MVTRCQHLCDELHSGDDRVSVGNKGGCKLNNLRFKSIHRSKDGEKNSRIFAIIVCATACQCRDSLSIPARMRELDVENDMELAQTSN